MGNSDIINKLSIEHDLLKAEIIELLSTSENFETDLLQKKAEELTLEVFGNKIYIRGLIEFTNYCKNNCFYCGIRKDNKSVKRYRLSKSDILDCCEKGYKLGFRTFVLQGGEDLYFNDRRLCDIVNEIKDKYPDTAVTLSVGERSSESYKSLFKSGADRFLLRQETAEREHYNKLHPSEMSFEGRMNSLKSIKEAGFQTGCGFMVGSPYQTLENIADDILFIKKFAPQMVGIGPFIPQKDTPFSNFDAGSLTLTLKILSIVRLMNPNLLLPSTTALATLSEGGRQCGIKAGANVIMPNLSPVSARKNYNLYDKKEGTYTEIEEYLKELKESLEKIDRQIVIGRGDFKEILKY